MKGATPSLQEFDPEQVRNAVHSYRELRANAAASASAVNRTHRVVRERAKALQARRSVARSLWIPLGICGGLLAVIVCAAWSVLDQYEAAPTGAPDASQQMFVLMMWCLPVSVILLAVVWFRRGGMQSGNDAGGEPPP